ncbi:MAG: phosphatase PAP2 family protein [Lachnospiraceae bacterium]|nr:phosphatase PAP2 family protein [Lachnospiraceae bacterium]
MGNIFYFDWEMELLYSLQSLHNPVLDKVMLFITTLGNAGMVWIAITILMFIFCKDKRCAWTSTGALLLSVLIINLILKNLVARARPCWIDTDVMLLLKNPKDYSFPSGHASASFATAVSILQFPEYRKQGIAALILATLIAFSRMYFFVHFPTDILVGSALGVLEALLAGYFVRKLEKNREFCQKR